MLRLPKGGASGSIQDNGGNRTVREKKQDFSWWNDEKIVCLLTRITKAGKLDHLRRKIDRINAAVDGGADVGKMNEFVKRGKFNGHNVDELIKQAK